MTDLSASSHLSAAVEKAFEYLVNGKPSAWVRTHTVDAVLANGNAIISTAGPKGRTWELRTSGVVRGIQAGDEVQVLYGGRKTAGGATVAAPIRILKHQARRGLLPPVLGVPGGGVVEELFIAEVAGVRDVWFRNDKQVTCLKLRSQLGDDPLWVKWGTRPDSFMVMPKGDTLTNGGPESDQPVEQPSYRYYIFTIDRRLTESLGAKPPTVKLVRVETPTAYGIKLFSRTEYAITTGVTRYFARSPDDGTNPSTVVEGDTYDWSHSRSVSQDTFLDMALLFGRPTSTSPSWLMGSSKKGFVADATLDDKLDLLLTIVAGPKGIALYDGVTPPTFADSDAIKSRNPDGADVTYDPNTAVYSMAVANVSPDHVFLVNATTRTVLFRTCVETIVQSTVKTGPDRFNRYKNNTTGLVQDLYNLGVNSLAEAVLSYSVDADTSSTFGGTEHNPYVASVSLVEYNPAMTYLTMPSFPRTSQAPDIKKYQYDGCNDGGTPTPTPRGIQITWNYSSVAQDLDYFFAGVYVPRAATAFESDGKTPKNFKKGWLFIKVQKQASPTMQQGFFCHDLESGKVTTIVPFTTNAVQLGSQAISLDGVWRGGPGEMERRQNFVVLACNGVHLLWQHATGTGDGGTVSIKLTRLSDGATCVVLTQTVPAEQTYYDGTGVLDPLRSYWKRKEQLFRPDYLWDGDLFAGVTKPANPLALSDVLNVRPQGRFVEAWNSQGLPTLDARAAAFPAEAASLTGKGTLLPLPAKPPMKVRGDVIGLNATGGPQNLEFQKQGSSYHMVNDVAALGPGAVKA